MPTEPGSLLLALHIFVAPARVSHVWLTPSPMESWAFDPLSSLCHSRGCSLSLTDGTGWGGDGEKGVGAWQGCGAHVGAHVGAIVLAEPWLLLLSKPHSEVVAEPRSQIPAGKMSLAALGYTSTTARTQEFSVHKYLNTCIFLYDRFIQCVPLSAVKSLQHL